MVLSSEDAEDILFKKHQELGHKLNLEPTTVAQAWQNFEYIRTSYTLEGDPLHWLGCAMFVACREATTTTVAQGTLEGNCVNLTSLLRNCNLSLAQFFNKIKRWGDMSGLNEEFKTRIDNLESNFIVSCNVFKQYTATFTKIFKSPTDPEQSKHHRNRKQRAVPCNATKVFEFTWNLFVTLKGKYLSCSNDLVTSVQLLFACCDLAFKNAFLSERRDLLKPTFEGLPLDWEHPNFVMPEEAPCIIHKIVEADSNIETEAMHMKVYQLKNFLEDMFTNGVLQGNIENFTELFDSANFDTNYKNVNRAYEAHLLNKGDFDERIFLAEYRRRTLLKEQASTSVPSSPFRDSGDSSVILSPRQTGEEAQNAPATPLTARRYVGPKEQPDVSSSPGLQTLARLQSMLNGRQAAPSDVLLQIFQLGAPDTKERVEEVVSRLGERFSTACSQQNTQEVHFAIKLFYKLVENILQNEKTIRRDISGLLGRTIFYECVLACSMEIIIYSSIHNNNSHSRKFPWILQVLDIQAYNFVKVIELIVRAKDQLPRDVVKHLSWVEESVIESLAWRTGSQLWLDIEKFGKEIPKFEDIALPGSLIYEDKRSVNTIEDLLHSPGPSAIDRFQSPIQGSSTAKKQLFPGAKQTHLVLERDGTKRVVSLIYDGEHPPTQEITPTKPKKPINSLGIFFRKFYNLAAVRMDDLCNKLEIADVELKRRIWTVFEQSIRNVTDLMRDRHLDQLLMCTVYVICKVSNIDGGITFTEIMRCYRCQPQAKSDVYRNVLLRPVRTDGLNNSSAEETNERGDLIKFYNDIYVTVMTAVITKFTSNSNQPTDLLLSPLPAPKSSLISPKFQIAQNVFLKPYESPSSLNTAKTHNYIFSRSPSKDLRNINKAINNGVGGKRLLMDGGSEFPNKKIVNRRTLSLLEDRKSQSVE